MNLPLRILPPVATVLASVLLGLLVVASPQIAFLAVLVTCGIAAVTAPAAAWAIAALIATMTFRGLVELGLLPSVATFADIGLAWGALAVAYLRRRGSSDAGRPLRTRLGLLASAILLAWCFHRSEVIRPLLYLALLGVPFALAGALLLDPPSLRLRRTLLRVLALLIALQIPVALVQATGHLVSGRGDPVQGTLYGAGAGTDTMSAIVAIGGFWWLTGTRGLSSWWRLPLAGLALSIPLIADAKQVVLALPAGVLAISPRRPRTIVLQALAVSASVTALFVLAPANAPRYLRDSASGHGGKQATASFVWSKLREDPASIAFGLGPAETVSRAALMTTDLHLGTNSPLRTFGLKPAEVAVEAQERALAASGGGTSFNSGVSSTLGVFGDLGVVGLLAYLCLPLWLIGRLRRSETALAVPAAAGWGMFLVLGLIFGWWEQPPFGIVLAVLTGLALSHTEQPTPSKSSVGS